MTDTQKQYLRVLRALAKVENNRGKDLEEYEDDVWSFFQNCWHLKDWVKNDNAIPETIRNSVETDVAKVQALVVCADLANRSKHLKLTRPRIDADVAKRDLTIHAAPPGKGYGEYYFKIQLNDGSELDAIEVAKKAAAEWQRLLASYGIHA